MVKAEEYRFVPDKLIAPPEVRFTLIFRNTGNLTHNLYFDREEYRTATVSPPSADTIQVPTPSAPDTLLYWCDVVGHRDAGMEGMLVVKP